MWSKTSCMLCYTENGFNMQVVHIFWLLKFVIILLISMLNNTHTSRVFYKRLEKFKGW